MRELKTPLSESDVKSLRAGDVIYLSGLVYTARDGAHQRALSEGRFPAEIKNGNKRQKDEKALRSQLELMVELGMAGIVIFAYPSLTPKDFKVLKQY